MKPFEVSVDIRRKLISLTMRGFWDVATFEAFAEDFVRGLHLLRRQGGCELALVDGREFAVQSRDILERFAKLMQENEPYLAKRTASIVPTELNRMQANRVTESIHRRDFTDRGAAESWLFGSQSGVSSAA